MIASGSRSAAALLALSLSVTIPSHAAEPFTPEQMKVIESLLEAQRVSIRREILAELKGAPTPTPTVVDDASAERRGPADLGVQGLDITPSPIGRDLEAVPMDRGMRKGISGLELEANSDAGEVRATLAHTRSVPDPNHNMENSWSVTASSPLDDKDNGRGHFTTLDALKGGTSLKVSLRHASTPRIVIDQDGVPSAEWVELCKLAGLPDANGCTLAAIDQAAQKGGADKLAEAYRRFELQHYGWGHIYEVNFGGGKKDFDYLTPDLKSKDSSREIWSVGGAIGFATPRRVALYALGFDYQRSYDPADDGAYCPEPTPPVTTCVTGSLGAPKRENKRLLWAEARSRVFHFPLAFRVTQDLANDETGVDLPIYLFRGEDQPFAGGVRVGWTSEDGAQGGVFIGSQFDVFR